MSEEKLSGIQILGAGLETILNENKFQAAFRKVASAAFADVFRAQDQGRLHWRRSGEALSEVVAKAVVKNGGGDNVTIEVIVTNGASDHGHAEGVIRLGRRSGGEADGELDSDTLCRNTYDAPVKRLFRQVFGRRWGT